MDIKKAVEATAADLVQQAFTFTGPSDAVDTIWLYISNQGGSTLALPVYSVGGQVCRIHELDDHLPEPVNSMETHAEALAQFSRSTMELIFAWEDTGEEEPTRVVFRYSVADQSLESEFLYRPISRGNDDTWGDVFENWVNNLAKTGQSRA